MTIWEYVKRTKAVLFGIYLMGMSGVTMTVMFDRLQYGYWDIGYTLEVVGVAVVFGFVASIMAITGSWFLYWFKKFKGKVTGKFTK